MSPQVRYLSTTVALVAVAVAYILWQRPLDRPTPRLPAASAAAARPTARMPKDIRKPATSSRR